MGLRLLAKRYGINQKTVAKWKQRTSVADIPTGPKDAGSTVLLVGDEVTVALRKHACCLANGRERPLAWNPRREA